MNANKSQKTPPYILDSVSAFTVNLNTTTNLKVLWKQQSKSAIKSTQL